MSIDCEKCHKMSHCCKTGACVDLENAKKIMELGLKGTFHEFKIDKDFPSGYMVATSYNDQPCTFLEEDGLCSIHKISYDLKPHYCKEFPLENGEVSPHVDELCVMSEEFIGEEVK